MTRQLHHGSAKQKQGNQVRNGHQAIEGICHAPQQAQIHSRAENRYRRVNHHEGLIDPGTEQELDAAGTVEAPADIVDRAKQQSATAVKIETQLP